MRVAGSGFVTPEVEAALPAVAISENHTIAVFYYTHDGFAGANGFPIISARLAASRSDGRTWRHHLIRTFVSAEKDNRDLRQRVLSAYHQLRAVGNTFFGCYTGNGAAFGRPIANHDPIFYTATAADLTR
jgi:hypothetical protein